MSSPAISKFVLGTAQLGLDYGINNVSGKPSSEAVKNILDRAWDAGIRILDGAEAYGDALERIGQYHAATVNRFDVIIRISSDKGSNARYITDRVLTHLGQLKISSAYAFMYHSFSDLQSMFPGHEGGLVQLREEGKIGRIGVSVYTNGEFESAIAGGKVDLIQIPYNLFDNETHRGKLIREAKSRGIEVHVRSLFLQGLFFLEPEKIQGKLRLLESPLREIRRIARDNDLTLQGLALHYAAQNNGISRMVIGIETAEQLNANIEAAKGSIRAEAVDQVNSISIKSRAILNPSLWKRGAVVCVTQARTGSSRLPGKVLKTVGGKTLLQIHLERLLDSERIDHLVVATTTDPADQAIVDLCDSLGITSYRGSSDDVLSRYFHAVKDIQPDRVVRVTSDCPLIDARLVDTMIDRSFETGTDYCSNGLEPTFPDGTDVEVFTFAALRTAHEQATRRSDREHVTPFIYRNSAFFGGKMFTSESVKNETDYSPVRLTVDEQADFEVVSAVIAALGAARDWRAYAEFYLAHGEINGLNKRTERNEGFIRSLENDQDDNKL